MEVNFLAVVLAAVATFFMGFLWYTVFFGKIWQKEIGMKDGGKADPPNMGKLLVGSFIIELVMAYLLAMFIGPDADMFFGLFAGLATGLGFVSLAFAISYMYEGKSMKLWLINAGYNTVIFSLMGAIIGAL